MIKLNNFRAQIGGLMSKHKKKSNRKAKAQGPDLPIEQAISQLKEEILEGVRALSAGRIVSLYKITELGEQLNKLEAELELTLKAEGTGNKEETQDDGEELDLADEQPGTIGADSF